MVYHEAVAFLQILEGATVPFLMVKPAVVCLPVTPAIQFDNGGVKVPNTM